MLTQIKIGNDQLYLKFMEAVIIPIASNKLTDPEIVTKQLIGQRERGFDIFFIISKNEKTTPSIRSFRGKEYPDRVTDINTMPRGSGDFVLVGRLEAENIEILHFDPKKNFFECIKSLNCKPDKLIGKVFTSNFRIFTSSSKFIFGFSKIGKIKIWDISELEEPKELPITIEKENEKNTLEASSGKNLDDNNLLSKIFGKFSFGWGNQPESEFTQPDEELSLNHFIQVVEDIWCTDYHPEADCVTFSILQNLKTKSLLTFSFNFYTRKIHGVRIVEVDSLVGVQEGVKMTIGNQIVHDIRRFKVSRASEKGKKNPKFYFFRFCSFTIWRSKLHPEIGIITHR